MCLNVTIFKNVGKKREMFSLVCNRIWSLATISVKTSLPIFAYMLYIVRNYGHQYNNIVNTLFNANRMQYLNHLATHLTTAKPKINWYRKTKLTKLSMHRHNLAKFLSAMVNAFEILSVIFAGLWFSDNTKKKPNTNTLQASL